MNPVQFKVSPINNKKMNNLKGMTVFNTEECDTKKQPMFFGKPLGVQRYDNFKYPAFAVSYTHLTLPTKRIV